MSQTRERVTLLVTELFLGLTAVIGMVGILSGGISLPKDSLQGSPFADYTVPGLCLGLLVGGSSIGAAVAVLRGHGAALPLSAAAGLAIIVFEAVEIVVIGISPVGLALQAFYVLVGVVILALAGLLWTSHSARPSPEGWSQRHSGGEST